MGTSLFNFIHERIRDDFELNKASVLLGYFVAKASQSSVKLGFDLINSYKKQLLNVKDDLQKEESFKDKISEAKKQLVKKLDAVDSNLFISDENLIYIEGSKEKEYLYELVCVDGLYRVIKVGESIS